MADEVDVEATEAAVVISTKGEVVTIRSKGNLRLLKINKRNSFNQNTIENIHNNTYQDFLLDGV